MVNNSWTIMRLNQIISASLPFYFNDGIARESIGKEAKVLICSREEAREISGIMTEIEFPYSIKINGLDCAKISRIPFLGESSGIGRILNLEGLVFYSNSLVSPHYPASLKEVEDVRRIHFGRFYKA